MPFAWSEANDGYFFVWALPGNGAAGDQVSLRLGFDVDGLSLFQPVNKAGIGITEFFHADEPAIGTRVGGGNDAMQVDFVVVFFLV
ncbi:hypothetical protein DF947_01435 [Pedobacter paludis]|uniref:Uncharacterized protein n=1 Tax=Pedobacter paludis TaxID=2203212 RepID=A0A317F6Z2_9SPHI|nr:hypothetical protein DF947_01435 [Pedobacter paludis]